MNEAKPIIPRPQLGYRMPRIHEMHFYCSKEGGVFFVYWFSIFGEIGVCGYKRPIDTKRYRVCAQQHWVAHVAGCVPRDTGWPLIQGVPSAAQCNQPGLQGGNMTSWLWDQSWRESGGENRE